MACKEEEEDEGGREEREEGKLRHLDLKGGGEGGRVCKTIRITDSACVSVQCNL